MVCVVCHESVLVSKSPLATAAASRISCRPAALGCGHTFHKECIDTWFRTSRNSSCPICHAPHAGPVLSLFIELDDAEQSPSARMPRSARSDVSSNASTRGPGTRRGRNVDDLASDLESLSIEEEGDRYMLDFYGGDISFMHAVHDNHVSTLYEEISELEETMADMLHDHDTEMDAIKESMAALNEQVGTKDRMLANINAKLEDEKARNAQLAGEIERLRVLSDKHRTHISSLQRALNKSRTYSIY
ncbi:hypothetical protein LPJ53_005722 [Coemansia erecta]|uniref:RING-type domain-containing protein n=1 Tax=Coemansia erecta TaxID=147472 RepID=A0A9W8CMV2_9FUNG|nr:hypothetical protein LPJ53_005722 [Coemansia erecta]